MKKSNVKTKVGCLLPNVGRIRFIIFVLLVFCLGQVVADPCGDVDSSGVIDIVDALLIAQAYVGLNPPNYDAMAADVDGDGAVDIIDALLIAQFYVGLILNLPGCTIPVDTSVTFSISDNLFDSSQPDTLGLGEATGTETITVFAAADNTDHYSNGAVLIPFKDKLYIMWQSSADSEDTADTWVAYSSSPDGVNWGAPVRLEVNSDGSPYNPGYARSSGGWWTDGNTLVAYINAWPGYNPRGGDVYYRTSSDGESWSHASRLTDNNGNPVYGIFEQDPHLLPGGRILSAVHVQSGGEASGGLYCYPYYTDDPMGISGWTRASMPHISSNSNNMSAELEPSSFIRADGGIVMVFRDQNGSFKKLASLSCDYGATWTLPVVTNMPDSRSKQCAGNLPNGTAYQVSNPTGNKNRYPLVITLSQDGKVFNRAYLLRSQNDLPDRRYPGPYKGYSYPKSTIWKGYLYVGYSVNKEDIYITRVPDSIQ